MKIEFDIEPIYQTDLATMGNYIEKQFKTVFTPLTIGEQKEPATERRWGSAFHFLQRCPSKFKENKRGKRKFTPKNRR